MSLSLLIHLLADLACLGVTVRGVYLKKYRRRDQAFSFALLNIVTFAVTYLLSSVRIEMGLALGLFAVFGILRYRTDALDIRDLTYLFVVLGLGMVNGIAAETLAWSALLPIDLVLVGAVVVLEWSPRGVRELTTPVLYDRLELLTPAKRGELHEDLSNRLGIQCERVDVQKIDMLRETAELLVTHRSPPKP